MIESTTILKVSFSEKTQTKSLVARWNAESKQWYAPIGVDKSPFEKWLASSPDANPTQSAYKPVKKSNTENNPLFDDDLDDINAKLRDAYESRDKNTF